MKMDAINRRSIFKLTILISSFWSLGTTVSAGNSTRMTYVCPPKFVRLGHSCYFFSQENATWHMALFTCQDLNSTLVVPARWEDRNLRNHLNKPDVAKASRWIGGIYDYGSRSWRWGGDLHPMRYQSFSRMKKMTPEDLQWHCIAMLPERFYRWGPRPCTEKMHYICQTKIRKVSRAKLKELRRRWQRMGKINEISAPGVSRETGDFRANEVYKTNDPVPGGPVNIVPLSPLHDSKTYDLKPNELRKRSKPRPVTHRKLKRPFPGYHWNRSDPEGSFVYNVNVLKSGRTNLTPQQVKSHMARLRRMRDKQLSRRKRLRDQDLWLVNDQPPAVMQTRARTYTLVNNISALHPNTIVEEFEMLAPPPPVAMRPVRGVW